MFACPRHVVAGSALAVLVSLPVTSSAQPPAVGRVSVSTSGAEAAGSSWLGSIGTDGRQVAFVSSASNLVADDTNSEIDAFVHDRLLRRTSRVSLTETGAEAARGIDLNHGGPFLSADGRFVAFLSLATLVAGDTDTDSDVYVRDRDADEDGIFDEPGQARVVRATVRSDGLPGGCFQPAGPCSSMAPTVLEGLSDDGRHVLFRTFRTLDDQDTNGLEDLYAHDLVTRRTTRFPGTRSGIPFNSRDISQTGRYLLVQSNVPPPAGFENVAVVDRDTNGNGVFDEPGDTSMAHLPAPPGPAAFSTIPLALSSDGVRIVFERIVNQTLELWLWHRVGGVFRRIMVAPPGVNNFGETRFAEDQRRFGFNMIAITGGPPNPVITVTRQIATFDADGDGHFDPPASIAVTPLTNPSPENEAQFDGTLRYCAFTSPMGTLVTPDTNGSTDVFVHDTLSPAFDTYDTDGDGLANTFEVRFGLNGASAAAFDGAAGDPDQDGLTNAQEQLAGSHPRGFFSRYLAEGATGPFFSTRISVANPGAAHATVLLRYQTDTGHTTSTLMTVPVLTRQFVIVGQVPSLTSASFSTVVESDVPVIVDRSMFWGEGLYGSSAETSVASPATTWYLAEGATHGFFDLFYLLQNPSPTTAAQVEVRYLLPAGDPVVRSYTVPPSTRLNILVDTVPGLEATDVSAVLRSTNNVPIIVERAMYFSRAGQAFGAGHASAGVTAPATTWRLAEGATGSFFDLFVLVANPSATQAEVRTTYLRPTGAPIVRTHTIAANSRLTIYVENEDPALADTPVSTVVESTNGVPIVVERAMWWPTPGDAWQEAHNSFGATQAVTSWGFADGEVGPPPANTQTYFLIANDTPDPALVAVLLLFDSGPPAIRHYTVPGLSRFNVPVAQEFPEAAGRGFGAYIVSMGTPGVPIVVERAMYSDANGIVWAAGTNVLGTPVP